MITGVHTMFYSSKPDELRAFIRDKLRYAGACAKATRSYSPEIADELEGHGRGRGAAA